jgi:two-component system sporulation sensor kinase B
MNTISGLTHILLQVFLILFPILLYHLYWGENDVLGDKRKSELAYGLMSTISIILCMFFTFPISNGYLLDLRAVPLIIAFLYGGWVSGLFVTVIFLVYRYYLSGGGFFIPLLTCSFLVPLLIVMIPRYNKSSSRYKSFLATIITLCTSVFIAVATCIKLTWSDIQISIETVKFFVGYTIIQTLTMWIIVALIESLREKVIMQYQLRKSDQLNIMSELAASVAHEIRNPLTVIRGFMQLFNEDKQIPEGVKPYIALIVTEIDRAQEIIVNFLSFAKPKLERIEKISVAEHIKHIIDLMHSYAMLQNVYLKTFITDSPYIKTDPDKFIQVLINIIKNGVEAMPNGGELEVSVKEVNGMAVISIDDHGVGMTEEEIQRLGEPFYSTKTKGTGIGLMVSYRLIEKMNGQIEIKSKKGVGTQFTIKFPKVIEK